MWRSGRGWNQGTYEDQKRDLIAQHTREMLQAAEDLEFERAAELRDSIAQIEKELNG